MTTEIAVANRLGIALATDSAVTITSGRRVKVFNTADKLFELSPQHPVGIMINGNMDCLGTPWELLIKEFRDKECAKSRATIAEWTTDFLSYIEHHSAIGSNSQKEYVGHVIHEEIEAVQTVVVSNVRDYIFKRGRLKSPRKAGKYDISTDAARIVSIRNNFVCGYGIVDSLTDFTIEQIVDQYKVVMDSSIKEQFIGQEFTDAEIADWRILFAEALRRSLHSRYLSGIVIAGYGYSESSPSVHEVEIDGKVLDKLKINRSDAKSIASSEDGGQVTYFAQTDVIRRLLWGADPQFINKSAEFIDRAVKQVAEKIKQVAEKIETAFRPKALSDRAAARRQKQVQDIADVITSEYVNETAPNLGKEFSREFDRMIAMMPKQELIELAEALVSITAVERKATSDEGTVGGPIDVAFITKHEGFVWIARKHYFKAELNPRYFWRRFGNPPNRSEP